MGLSASVDAAIAEEKRGESVYRCAVRGVYEACALSQTSVRVTLGKYRK